MSKNNKNIRKCIDEYIGKQFRFLEKYMNGGYEEYVKENIQKISHKNVFGKITKRKEYKHIHSLYLLEQEILNDCEKTIDYINENI